MGVIDFSSKMIHPSKGVINLAGKSLTELPDELFRLEGITSLYLSDNNLTSIPHALLDLKDLHTIDLSGNPRLQECPDLTSLEKLRFLILPIDMSKFPKTDRKQVELRVT